MSTTEDGTGEKLSRPRGVRYAVILWLAAVLVVAAATIIFAIRTYQTSSDLAAMIIVFCGIVEIPLVFVALNTWFGTFQSVRGFSVASLVFSLPFLLISSQLTWVATSFKMADRILVVGVVSGAFGWSLFLAGVAAWSASAAYAEWRNSRGPAGSPGEVF